MVSLIYLVPRAQLRIRSLQFRLRSQWSSIAQDDLVQITWTPENLTDLQWWMLESSLLAGRDLWDMSLDFLLYIDASTHGCGCSLLHHTVGGLWSKEESILHIILLELQAVRLALLQFQHLLQGKTVGVFANNTTDLAYHFHQEGTHSLVLINEGQWTLHWTESKLISSRPQFISGSRNVMADSISWRFQVLSTEWTLHHEVYRAL